MNSSLATESWGDRAPCGCLNPPLCRRGRSSSLEQWNVQKKLYKCSTAREVDISTFKNLVTPRQHTALPRRERRQGICVPRATAKLITPEMPGQPDPGTTVTAQAGTSTWHQPTGLELEQNMESVYTPNTRVYTHTLLSLLKTWRNNNKLKNYNIPVNFNRVSST